MLLSSLFLFACFTALTAYQIKTEGEYRTWMTYARVALFTASLFAVLSGIPAGIAALVCSVLAGIAVSFSAACSDNEDWGEGLFASSLLVPFALFLLYIAAQVTGWQSLSQFSTTARGNALGDIVQGYCGTLFFFIPLFWQIRSELDKY